MNTLYDKAYSYCETAKTSPDVPKYVKKQCAILKDIFDDNHDKFFVNTKICDKINKLLTLLTMPTGFQTGKPVINSLLPYQCLFFVASFCVVYRDEPTKRKHERVILEICRKQGKSFIVGLTFIIQLLLAPRFSRLYSVAPDGALSKEVKIAIEQLIQSCPYLNDKYKGKLKFKINRDVIKCLLTDNNYYPLNYSNSRLDGKMPSVYVVDEVGALPNSYALTAMSSGQATVINKLGFVISTKYPKIDNPFESEVSYAKQILDGIIQDDKVLSFLYEPDEVKGWETNDTIIRQANPTSIEIPEMYENLLYNRSRAINISSERGQFLCKHCNIIASDIDTESYVDPNDVEACEVSEPIDWTGKDVYIGLDLALTTDNVAVSMVSRDEYGHLICEPMAFIPTDRKEIKETEERCDYSKYIEENKCIACGSDVVDYGTIEHYIQHIEERYGCNVVAVGYDRYNAMSSVCKLESGGISCVEVKQHSSVLASPTKLLHEEICTHNFKFSKNELFKINFSNAKVQYDTNMNKYIHKKKSRAKVDMVVSTITALSLLEQAELLETNWICE